CFFFFFQAEDGIRDKLVTGVQTCALPICERVPLPVSRPPGPSTHLRAELPERVIPTMVISEHIPDGIFHCTRRDNEFGVAGHIRSEERRVGKESRSGCGRARCNNNTGLC